MYWLVSNTSSIRQDWFLTKFKIKHQIWEQLQKKLNVQSCEQELPNHYYRLVVHTFSNDQLLINLMIWNHTWEQLHYKHYITLLNLKKLFFHIYEYFFSQTGMIDSWPIRYQEILFELAWINTPIQFVLWWSKKILSKPKRSNFRTVTSFIITSVMLAIHNIAQFNSVSHEWQ